MPIKVVKENSKIEIKYKLHLMDGTLVDEATDDSFTFTLGEGQMLEKLETLLIGLEEGTTASFVIEAKEAFGDIDPNNFHEMDIKDFPAEMKVKAKMVIGFEGVDGEEIPGVIKAIEEDKVIVDFNHPLSGQTIKFEASIISIKDS